MKLSLELLICLSFLVNPLFELLFHLLLSQLDFLSVLINELSHAFDLIISVNDQIFILNFECCDSLKQLSLLLLNLEVLLPQLVKLLVQLNIG